MSDDPLRKFVPPELAERLRRDPGRARLGAETRAGFLNHYTPGPVERLPALDAKAEFNAVLRLLPDDRVSRMYLSMCDDLRDAPPAELPPVFNLTP